MEYSYGSGGDRVPERKEDYGERERERRALSVSSS